MSAFNSGIQLRTGEMFFVVPQKLSLLTEKVLRAEGKIFQLWRGLPPIALRSYIRDLISQEVEFTNQIEGVRSTRKEIADVLASIESDKEDRAFKRFREFAGLYLNLSSEELDFPKGPSDVRNIFDLVMQGEVDKKDQLDGKLFRAGPVEILSGHRSIHEGVTPESRIVEMLQDMITMTENEDVPVLYTAIASHFLFEYIHPFYDGNGRTGRLLLALYLSRPLSIATALSLSRTIAENLPDYYKAFEEVEHGKNHGEITFFIIEMMQMIRAAQENLEEELKTKRAQLDRGKERLEGLGLSIEDEVQILFSLLQIHLFATNPIMSLKQAAEVLDKGTAAARRYMGTLSEKDYVKVVAGKPLKFALTDKAIEALR